MSEDDVTGETDETAETETDETERTPEDQAAFKQEQEARRDARHPKGGPPGQARKNGAAGSDSGEGAE